MSYQVQDLSIKASHCRLDHPDLPICADGGVLVHLIEVDGRLQVMIEVGENTTYDDLVSGGAVSLALKWRDAVRAWQGAYDPAVLFVERLLAENRGEPYYQEGASHYAKATREGSGPVDKLAPLDRKTYRELAQEINQRLSELVIEHSALQQRRQDILAKMDAAEPPIRTINEIFASEWAGDAALILYGSFHLEHARDLLSIVTTLSPQEIDEYLLDGLARAENGEPPFDHGAPLDRDNIKQVLDNWRKNRLPRIRGAKRG